MKISIITTITNPDERQYAWAEAIRNYLALADEVVIVNGGEPLYENLDFMDNPRLRIINLPWPDKWHWSELPVHLNAGLEAATGVWVIKTDIDYFFHEKDMPTIRFGLNEAENYAIAGFQKRGIINRNRYYNKCDLPVAINKASMGSAIKFGIDPDQETDWCFPVMVNGEKTFKNGNKVPLGKVAPENLAYGVGIPIWNYDAFFRTKEVQKKEFWRFAQAYATAFDKSWGKTEEGSFKYWVEMMRSRVAKIHNPLDILSHPIHIQERLKAMTPDEWGYNNWDKLKGL
ncbi:hypothetical protein LCGC14_1679540 [marine sediment metagenome]|uniref:Glycosyltransferase 2-like domain-containing protein n=1 Tax=marine sediment metagenome TaxID=412755 RepID=A0A0F9HPK3_9ZZZZ